jgi:transposase
LSPRARTPDSIITKVPPRQAAIIGILRKEHSVDQIHDRVAGLDVHRDSVVACARHLGPRGGIVREKQQFAATTAGLRLLASWLGERQAELVAMEATGVYWKPVYYALEHDFTVWLCNARHVKKVPGRKTDLSDAEWLADVAAHGMVRSSFVPPPPIRELRELTRYRKTQIDVRVGEIQRLEKVLQDAGVKLTSVASKVLTQSGRAMIEAMIAGERDPAVVAELAKGKMRPKIPALTEALEGHFGAHHAVAAQRILAHLDFLDTTIAALTEQIDARTGAFQPVYELLLPVPGLERPSIDVIVAETGADMTRFPTAGDLSSWAGVCPGNHESAGKRRRVATTPGNPWLRRTLIECARAAVRTKGSYFGAQYRQIAHRRGPNKAAVAVAHSLTKLVWHLLTTGEVFSDLGDDYFLARNDREHRARRLVTQLEQLGFTVTVATTTAA